MLFTACLRCLRRTIWPFLSIFYFQNTLRIVKDFRELDIFSCSLSKYVTYRWLILTNISSWPKLWIIFDRHVSDVSVSHWCRWPNDRKRFSELLYHWPGEHSCQRCYQDHVWHQQPNRSNLHERCWPGPRGEMMFKVEMQIIADHHSLSYFTKTPFLLS